MKGEGRGGGGERGGREGVLQFPSKTPIKIIGRGHLDDGWVGEGVEEEG